MDQHYKGRLLSARAYELQDGTGWEAEVHITDDPDAGTEMPSAPFPVGRFSTKNDALKAGYEFGKREVDSMQIPGVVGRSTILPSTHGDSLGRRADDVAARSDGKPTRVPGPDNPEDRRFNP
jgi:hypothetical protein